MIHSLIGNSITKELQKAYCHWKLLTKKRDTEQTVSLGADYAVRNLKHIDDNRDKSFYNFDNDLAMTGATTLFIFTTYLATSIAIWIITYHLPR